MRFIRFEIEGLTTLINVNEINSIYDSVHDKDWVFILKHSSKVEVPGGKIYSIDDILTAIDKCKNTDEPVLVEKKIK